MDVTSNSCAETQLHAKSERLQGVEKASGQLAGSVLWIGMHTSKVIDIDLSAAR